jgi:RNA polymerase sigma factor (sigma-70 family)
MTSGTLGTLLGHLRQLAGGEEVGRLTDGELLRRFIAGDETAFAVLVARQGPMVYGVCRRVLHRLHEAEDAFQATFLVLARRAATITRHEAVGSWLYKVAYHVALKAKLGAARRAARESRAENRRTAPPDPGAGWAELRPMLDEELAQLPDKFRAPLVLCYFQGKTYAEAARELGCSRGTLSGHMAQARSLLRARLTRRGLTLSAELLGLGLAAGAATAAVPPALLQATTRGALSRPAGKGPTGVLSDRVLALAEGTPRALFRDVGKAGGGVVVLVGLLALAVASAHHARTATTDVLSAAGRGPLRGARLASAWGTQRGHVPRVRDPLPPGALVRLGTNRLRHGLAVLAVAVAPDGRTWASAGLTNTLKLWDAATGRKVATLAGPDPTEVLLGDVAYSPDGSLLATAGNGVRVWDTVRRKMLWEARKFHRWGRAVAFSPDGTALAAAGRDGTLRLWEGASGKEIRRLKGHRGQIHALAFSPDDKTLVAGGEDGAVHLWAWRTGRRLGHFRAHAGAVSTIAFSLDAKVLASGGNDRTVCFWDAATGRPLHRPGKVKGPVLCVRFAPDGRRVVSASGVNDALGTARVNPGEGEVKLWDVARGRELRRFTGRSPFSVIGVAFSPDGKDLVGAGGRSHNLRHWKVDTGREELRFGGHQGEIERVAFSADGKALATAGDRTVRIWDAATGEALYYLPHRDEVNAVAYSPDGRLLASAGVDGQVSLWRGATGQKVRRLVGHRSPVGGLAFSPDGRTLASGGRAIRLWDVGTGKPIRRLAGHGTSVHCLAFSPDGKGLASGGQDHRIHLWDVRTGQEFRCLEGNHWYVTHVAFSPDGKTLASSGYAPGVQLWEVRTGWKLRTFAPAAAGFCCLAFSPDGRTLAVGCWDRLIRLYDPRTGELRCRLAGHEGPVISLAFAGDGSRVASGSMDTTVLVWGVTGKKD